MELTLDLGRQTGGPGFVVSDHAILDADVHGHLPEPKLQLNHAAISVS